MANPRHKASTSGQDSFTLLGYVLLSLTSLFIYCAAMAYSVGSRQWVVGIVALGALIAVAAIGCLIKGGKFKR